MRTLQESISDHLARLIDTVKSQGVWTIHHDAGSIIEQLTEAADVKKWAFDGLAGTVADQALAVSGPGGSKGRISVASKPLADPNADVIFHVGCFRDNGEKLLQMSKEKHGLGSEEYKHYARFNEAAEFLLMRTKNMPPLADVVFDKVIEIHDRRDARATQTQVLIARL